MDEDEDEFPDQSLEEEDYELGRRIDRALRARTHLDSATQPTIELDQHADFIDLLNDLNDYGRSATPDLASKLGVNQSLLNKFFNQQSVDRRTARIVADRIVTHLRSIEPELKLKDDERPVFTRLDSRSDGGEHPFEVKATEWKVVLVTPGLREQLQQLTALIDEVVQHAIKTNLPPYARALTEIERAQLVAVLKTAIKILESPMMEKGILNKAKEAMEKGALSAIEKGVENAFSFAAGFAAGKLSDFIGHVF